MSIIPQRKRDTPLLKYFAEGTYDRSVSIERFKNRQSFPGYSATMNERNRSIHDEVNIKPITQQTISKEFYQPLKCLNPFKDSIQQEFKSDVSNNNQHLNRLWNQKKSINERLKNTIEQNIIRGTNLDQADYFKKKNMSIDQFVKVKGKKLKE